MRLFTGLAVGASVADVMERTLSAARASGEAARWSPRGNLHVTTKFIGEWPEGRLEELMAALAAMRVPVPFEVRATGFGFLGEGILCARVALSEGLTELADSTDGTLAQLGVKRETHGFTPHITVARKAGRVLPPVVAELGGFTAGEFHLYESRPGAAGSLYSILRTYSLKKAAV